MIFTFAKICQAEIRRQLRQNWSYRFETIGEIALWLVAFPMMMLIFESVAASYDKMEQTASLFGFLIWDLCFGVMVVTTQGITQESRQGTLEAIFLSPVSPLLLFSARTSAAFVVRAIRSSMLAYLLAWVLGLHIQMSGAVWLLIGIMIASAFGLTLLLSGVAFVYKEIGSVIGVLSLLATLATGVLVPLNSLGFYFVLMKILVPFAWGIDTLRSVTASGSAEYISIDTFTWLGLVLQTTFLLSLGVFVFKQGYMRARERNLLGSY